VYVTGKIPKDAMTKIKNVTSYRPEGYQFMASFKSGRWDGKYHLYESSYGTQRFPLGMIHDVVEILKSYNTIKLEMFDNRKRPLTKFDWKWNDDFRQLRDYQTEAVEAAKKTNKGYCKASDRFRKDVSSSQNNSRTRA
jgi:hypothetical protein